jgi:hypothetical protein
METAICCGHETRGLDCFSAVANTFLTRFPDRGADADADAGFSGSGQPLWVR